MIKTDRGNPVTIIKIIHPIIQPSPTIPSLACQVARLIVASKHSCATFSQTSGSSAAPGMETTIAFHCPRPAGGVVEKLASFCVASGSGIVMVIHLPSVSVGGSVAGGGGIGIVVHSPDVGIGAVRGCVGTAAFGAPGRVIN